jgi:hypothetical protein
MQTLLPEYREFPASQECPSDPLWPRSGNLSSKKLDMKTNGQKFIEQLAGFPPRSFESKFSKIATRLHLAPALDRAELECLFEAALLAILCNISFNGLGGCGGIIKPDRETNRIRLEREFMAACDKLYAAAGWKALPPFVRHPIQTHLLHVSVHEENLMP